MNAKSKKILLIIVSIVMLFVFTISNPVSGNEINAVSSSYTMTAKEVDNLLLILNTLKTNSSVTINMETVFLPTITNGPAPTPTETVVPTIPPRPTLIPTIVPTITRTPANTKTATPIVTVVPTIVNTVPVNQSSGIWISQAEIMALPMSGNAWDNVKSAADSSVGSPNLADQNDNVNVIIMAKALVYARTGTTSYLDQVKSALTVVANTPYTSYPYSDHRALALGRELAAYVISADLINLKVIDPTLDARFRIRILELRNTATDGGPASLVKCNEQRPNNWGMHCGASRIAVDLYLGETLDLNKAAKIFQGWLGDRNSYSGFSYGDLSWQCNSSTPVGVNPAGCTKNGYNIDGVLPDDQRRAGGFSWPPSKENYVYEALQGAVAQSVMLSRAGYDSWNWSDKAMLRAYIWLNNVDNFPAGNDDTWEPFVINRIYGSNFVTPSVSSPGKNVGWTDWTN